MATTWHRSVHDLIVDHVVDSTPCFSSFRYWASNISERGFQQHTPRIPYAESIIRTP